MTGTTVGFVGLGDIGAPMARRILDAGFGLHVFARRPEVAEEWTATGASVEPSLQDLGAVADIVCIVVSSDEDVLDVVSDEHLLARARPGTTLVVHSTVLPATCTEAAARAAAVGVDVVDAPVSGGRARAATGDLVVIVGGDAGPVQRVRPVLDAMGSLVAHVGPLGSGQVTKLINNYVYAAHVATAEIEIQLVRELGLDEAAAAEVLCASTGASWRFQSMAGMGFDESKRHALGVPHMRRVLAEEVERLRSLVTGTDIDLARMDALIEPVLAVGHVDGP